MLLQTLMDSSQSLQTYIEKSDSRQQAAAFQKLRDQHAQLLAFNHMLVEENNNRLVDHAEIVSEVSTKVWRVSCCVHDPTKYYSPEEGADRASKACFLGHLRCMFLSAALFHRTG